MIILPCEISLYLKKTIPKLTFHQFTWQGQRQERNQVHHWVVASTIICTACLIPRGLYSFLAWNTYRTLFIFFIHFFQFSELFLGCCNFYPGKIIFNSHRFLAVGKVETLLGLSAFCIFPSPSLLGSHGTLHVRCLGVTFSHLQGSINGKFIISLVSVSSW